jgi:hypothetical protein
MEREEQKTSAFEPETSIRTSRTRNLDTCHFTAAPNWTSVMAELKMLHVVGVCKSIHRLSSRMWPISLAFYLRVVL